MKNLISFWIIVTIIFANACTESGIDNGGLNGSKIKLSTRQVEVNFEGMIEHKITVNSPCSWEAESKNDWLKVITKQGVAGAKELSFYANNNYDLEKREGTIIVTNRDYGYINELYVTQKGFIPYIKCPETIAFDAKGGYQIISITANCSWDYSDNASWFSLSHTDNGLQVTASEYTSINERTAEITLSNSKYNIEKIIKVTQKAFEPRLEIDKTELNFDVNGGSMTVFVTTNAEFNISSHPSWFSCQIRSNRVTFTASASDVTTERTAEVKIYLTNYNLSESIKVTQKKFVPEFEVKTVELEFEADGGMQTIPINTNFDYNVSISESWLSYERTSSGIKLTATANIDEQDRSADVKIYNNTYNKSATVKVTQKKFVPEFEVKTVELEFEADGGMQTIPINTNFDYNVSISESWLSYERTSSGIKLTATANIDEQDRSADVKIYNNTYNKSATVKVTQKKFVPEFEVEDINTLEFDFLGIDRIITVSSNIDYNFKSNVDWISCSKVDQGIKISVSLYTDIEDNRVGEIVIYSDQYHTPSKAITITQTALPKANVILYTTANADIVSVEDEDLGALIISNKYENRQGIIKCKSEIKSIGMYAFNSTDIRTIVLPENLQSIEYQAFYHCNDLIEIVIPDNTISIGIDAFRYCYGLKSVTLGRNISSIKSRAFNDCWYIESVYCKSLIPPTLADDSLLPSYVRIYVPKESIDEYKSATIWAEHANDIIGYDFEE